MKTSVRSCFAAFLAGLVALTPFVVSAAVAPHSKESMEQEKSTHVVRGKVVALSSKTQKSRRRSSRSDFLIARDRIFKITVEVIAVEKGKDVKEGDELKFRGMATLHPVSSFARASGASTCPKQG